MTQPHDDARLVVSVRPSSGHESIPTVELAGTGDALVWLAERMLEVARAEKARAGPDRHTHLDAELCGPIYQSSEGWRLTISRIEELRGATPA